MAIKRCKASFAASVRGVPRVMRVGALVSDDDPVLKGREHLFEDVEAAVQEPVRVEDASAAPGRRRSLTRQAVKKAAAKPKPAKQESEQSGPQAADGAKEGTAS
ncbi:MULTISPECIES: hypothetical protein [unclassified Streptomyces]|uniref:hypothetical protein n=1 Tax=unclassified Streptomyces TaxID=2593676 RepID=UPI001489B32C|nr:MULTISPECIES: hypothetical protein [unclassified Streptomyces]